MQTILITGGSGLVGKYLNKLLIDKGYQVIIMGRSLPKTTTATITKHALWDIENQTIDDNAIKAADVIINLAGAGVADKRWTKARKDEILSSRVNAGKLIVKALTEIPNKVHTIINASATGWYKSHENSQLKNIESEESNTDFLGNTCMLWEESINPVLKFNKRLVKFRIGIVLSNDGGALKEFKKPLNFGVAAILGDGEQVISWIHIHDLCRAFIAAIENTNLDGVYNAVAPHSVSNKQLTLTLAKEMKGKLFIPIHVPSFILKIALGEMSEEVLKTASISCEKIQNEGFVFLYPSIESALKNLISNQ